MRIEIRFPKGADIRLYRMLAEHLQGEAFRGGPDGPIDMWRKALSPADQAKLGKKNEPLVEVVRLDHGDE